MPKRTTSIRGKITAGYVLGFFFLPTTLLWYSAVQRWFHGQWTFWPIVGIIIALMIDVSPAKKRRER